MVALEIILTNFQTEHKTPTEVDTKKNNNLMGDNAELRGGVIGYVKNIMAKLIMAAVKGSKVMIGRRQ